jgi:hypothetical protein
MEEEERAEVIQALLILATNDLEFLRSVRYAPAYLVISSEMLL